MRENNGQVYLSPSKVSRGIVKKFIHFYLFLLCIWHSSVYAIYSVCVHCLCKHTCDLCRSVFVLLLLITSCKQKSLSNMICWRPIKALILLENYFFVFKWFLNKCIMRFEWSLNGNVLLLKHRYKEQKMYFMV